MTEYIYNFDTPEESEAVAALLIYAIYKSRDKEKFKISTDMWDRIARFSKASAKTSKNIGTFIESLKVKLCCGSMSPKWSNTFLNMKHAFIDDDGDSIKNIIEISDDSREFLTSVIRNADHKSVLNKIYKETELIVILVRERLEREKIETKLKG